VVAVRKGCDLKQARGAISLVRAGRRDPHRSQSRPHPYINHRSHPLHPFSSLAVATRGGDTFDTFFINRDGLLTTANWARWFTDPWPGFQVQPPLESSPGLLPGGALAAVSSQPSNVMVFGVGRDLRLGVAVFINGNGWGALMPVGQPQDLLGAHTRLAAHAPTPDTIEVAALTDTGRLVVYGFSLSGTTLTPGQRQVVDDPPDSTGDSPASEPGAPLVPADGYRINPFTDLSILRMPAKDTSTVFCAGLRGGRSALLRCDLGPTPSWQAYV
jgi:hypothetical protein